MTEKSAVSPASGPLSFRKIIALISEKRYDDARSLIEAERNRLPEEAHRLTALSAYLHESLGEVDKGIALMRQALRERPAWLPHLYQLSVMLMDARRWDEADFVLKEIVGLSLAMNDSYFLNESRFRRAVCLRMLGRLDEFERARAEIPAGTRIFIGDQHCTIDEVLW